jgi:hypothetical protein
MRVVALLGPTETYATPWGWSRQLCFPFTSRHAAVVERRDSSATSQGSVGGRHHLVAGRAGRP